MRARRAPAVVIAVLLLAGCAAPTMPDSGQRDSGNVIPDSPVADALELVGLWQVGDAIGEPVGTALWLGAGHFAVTRDCGVITGTWRGAGERFAASIVGSQGCDPAVTVPAKWLDVASAYRLTEGDVELLDENGAAVAILSPGGEVDMAVEHSLRYAHSPELTPELLAYFSEPAPLPGGMTPVSTDSLLGRWAPEALSEQNAKSNVTFSTRDEWTASDGCNTVSGAWFVAGARPFIAPHGAMTQIGCDNTELPTFISATAQAGFSADGELVLFDRDGTELVRLVKN